MDEINVEKRVIEMLNNYYGDSRTESFKEEVAGFVSAYLSDIKELIESIDKDL